MNRQLQNLFLMTMLIILVIGCTIKPNIYKTFINDNIPSNIQREISSIDNKVIQAIKNNNPQAISEIFSPKLLKNGGDKLDSIFNVTSGILKGGDIKKLDDLYVENATQNVSNTIFTGLSNEDDYIIHYKALTKNVFISLNRVTTEPNELLISLIYGKTSIGWKLYHLQFGTYSLYGKTAIDFYNIGKRYDSLGYIVDAANTLFFAQQTLKPGNQLWQYKKEKEIIDLQKSVMDKIYRKYQFPLTVEQVETKPQIYQIYPHTFNDRYETIIKYYSQIDLKDTTRLKAENLKMREVIGKIFIGLDKEKEYLIYQATNELPDGTLKDIPIYGFVQEFGVE